jgi:hypothetical protein
MQWATLTLIALCLNSRQASELDDRRKGSQNKLATVVMPAVPASLRMVEKEEDPNTLLIPSMRCRQEQRGISSPPEYSRSVTARDAYSAQRERRFHAIVNVR